MTSVIRTTICSDKFKNRLLKTAVSVLYQDSYSGKYEQRNYKSLNL